MSVTIKTLRLYDHLKTTPGHPKHGDFRVFVDRIWPRGISKQEFHYDAWYKDLAPSSELRKWFGHEVSRWDEFTERYKKELAQEELKTCLKELLKEANSRPITLLYGAKDNEHNQAVILEQAIKEIA